MKERPRPRVIHPAPPPNVRERLARKTGHYQINSAQVATLTVSYTDVEYIVKKNAVFTE
ncbi:MAG TPA: hypothetical protein VGZ02_12745 [Candidatus Baltobacteraceae bacterium]|jgi:hypothetical protein|nr:hypothetical protein [Candidatus Baltobacteraceae bacterium]